MPEMQVIIERLVLEKDEADLEAGGVAEVEMKMKMMMMSLEREKRDPTHTKQIELVEEMRKRSQRLLQLQNLLLRQKSSNQRLQLLNQHQNLHLSLLRKHQSQHQSRSQQSLHQLL